MLTGKVNSLLKLVTKDGNKNILLVNKIMDGVYFEAKIFSSLANSLTRVPTIFSIG